MILYRKFQGGGDGSAPPRMNAIEFKLDTAAQSSDNFSIKLSKPPTVRTFDNPTYAAMSKVMTHRNSKLPWVKRFLGGNKQFLPADNGKRSSHLLSTFGGDNGEEYVAPLIVQKNNELVKLSPDNAWKHAVDNKSLMRFKSKEFADYYSKNGLIKH